MLPFPFLRTELRDYQKRAADNLLKFPTGLLLGPTGCGKTLIALEIIRSLNAKTIFLTHRVGLARQTARIIKNEFGAQPSLIAEGKTSLGYSGVTVGVIQSVVRIPIPDEFDCVIIDEAHHLPAATFKEAFEKFPAPWKYALAAILPGDKIRRDTILASVKGHVTEIFSCEIEETFEVPEVIFCHTGLSNGVRDFCESKCKLRKETKPCEKLCEFAEGMMYIWLCDWVDSHGRNLLVLQEVKKLILEDFLFIIVLTERVRHVRELVELFKREIPGTVFEATGKMKPQELSTVLDLFRFAGGVLVGTESLLQEGLDLPEGDALVLAAPAGGKTKVTQRVGRILRGIGRKRIIDITDQDEYSRRLFFARNAIYKRLDFKIRHKGGLENVRDQ